MLRAFREQSPLAVVTGAGYRFGNHLVSLLEERVDVELDVLRLSDPAPNPLECMRGIVESIGFSTEGLDLSDLQQILTMFLSYQKTHHRRTILFVEDAHRASSWTLDTLDRLVAREKKKKNGLLVLLAGDGSLDNLLRRPGISTLSAHTDFKIRCAAFDLRETRDYISRFVEAGGRGEISEMFEFDAITRLHDISDGVPDTINQLIGECLRTSRQTPISPRLVENVATDLKLISESNELGLTIMPPPCRGWLEIRLGNEMVERRAIESEKLVIGRHSGCDLRLFAPVVSREHALVVALQDDIRILDLGSTNGTFVNGERIENCPLDNDAGITIGNYEIRFRSQQ